MEHAPRVDDARRHLVARERVVVDLDALVGGRRRPAAARAGRWRRRRPRGCPARRARRRAWPARWRAGRRASEPGTASSARPAASSARPSAGVRRNGRSKYSARRISTPPSITDTSINRSAVYGGSPHIGSELEVALELALAPPRSACASSSMRRRRGARGSTAPARARAAAADRRAAGSRRARLAAVLATASSHATMSARSSGGDSTSAWSSRSSDPRAERGAVHDRRASTHDRAVGPPLEHRLVAELVDHPRGPRRVDEHVGVDRLVLAVGHAGRRARSRRGRSPRAARTRPARPSVGLAVDAVDPERPGRVAVVVVADHVPVARTAARRRRGRGRRSSPR